MITAQKQLMRQEMKALLKKNAPRSVFQKKSASFEQQLEELASWREAHSILLYGTLPGEPCFLSMLEKFSARRFFFPRVVQDQLHLYQWHAGARWVVGRYNLQEPDPQTWQQVSIAEADLALIPGLAFDQHGGRLGRGAGFYDRLLSHPEWRGVKVGVAWSWQIVPHVPREEHDVLMDCVLIASRCR